jgi:hypothetical protein
VPMISREPNFAPAITSGSSVTISLTSSSLDRGQHFDLIPRGKRHRRPGGPAHHLAVDSYRYAGG